MHGYYFYNVVERAGSSPDTIEAAMARANSTPRNRGWFEVVETRAHIESVAVHPCPVTLKAGITLDDGPGSASPPDRRQPRRVT